MQKKNLLFGISIIILFFLFSCSNSNQSAVTDSKNNQSAVTESAKDNKVKLKFPYEFLDSKMETENNSKNKMDLYAYSGNLNLDTLSEFCKNQKAKFESGTFYYLVIFDKKVNAGFPKNPFSAAYGVDEEHLKHIRAYYTFNRLNNFSKLDYYEKNQWESSAKTVDIN